MPKQSKKKVDMNPPLARRRPYSAPVLATLGQARDVTKVVDNMGARDGGMGRMRRTG